MRVYVGIRLITTAAVAASLVAVLVGRSAPRTPFFRYDPVSWLSVIDGRALQRPPMVLDTRTGTLSPLPFPARQGLRWGSISPWVDGDGERDVVGWWTATGPSGAGDTVQTDCGLARLTLSGGRLVESVPDAPVPIGYPCWDPHHPQRLLYPAGDGRLYHVDLNGSDRRGSTPPRIQPVSWSKRATAGPGPFVESVCWPGGHAVGGRLLAAVRFPGTSGHAGRTRLCWLTLAPSGTEVTDVETISVGDDTDANDLSVTCASLCTRSDGSWLVAFQCAQDDGRPNALWLATSDANELLTSRVIPSAKLRLLADRVARVPATFSPGGEAVYAVVPSRERSSAVRRFFLGPGYPSSKTLN